MTVKKTKKNTKKYTKTKQMFRKKSKKISFNIKSKRKYNMMGGLKFKNIEVKFEKVDGKKQFVIYPGNGYRYFFNGVRQKISNKKNKHNFNKKTLPKNLFNTPSGFLTNTYQYVPLNAQSSERDLYNYVTTTIFINTDKIEELISNIIGSIQTMILEYNNKKNTNTNTNININNQYKKNQLKSNKKKFFLSTLDNEINNLETGINMFIDSLNNKLININSDYNDIEKNLINLQELLNQSIGIFNSFKNEENNKTKNIKITSNINFEKSNEFILKIDKVLDILEKIRTSFTNFLVHNISNLQTQIKNNTTGQNIQFTPKLNLLLKILKKLNAGNKGYIKNPKLLQFNNISNNNLNFNALEKKLRLRQTQKNQGGENGEGLYFDLPINKQHTVTNPYV